MPPIQLPLSLTPSGQEIFTLASGRELRIPKATPTFEPWLGAPLPDTFGGKQVLDFRGEAVFAELAILRAFQAEGWQGGWIDTYRQQVRCGMSESFELPTRRQDLLNQIYATAGSRSGCFDVFVWKGDAVVFAESKRKKRDRIRKTQVRWLEAALAHGISPFQLLVVEWSLPDAADR